MKTKMFRSWKDFDKISVKPISKVTNKKEKEPN